MKKLIFTLFVTIIAFSGMAQTIGDAFFVYRNDGKFNAFLREEVDSIVYSYYDADSIRFDEVVSQIVFTKDSAYWIPLAAIDSVAFVTPQTVYQDDVVNLDGRLFDYVSFANGMILSLSKATPHDLLPKTGEKLVALKLSEKFPYGFLGKVVNISENDSNILITCDSISLEDAVKRFFGTINAVSTNENDNIPKSRARDISSDSWQQTFVINTIKIPFDFSGVVKKKDILNFAGKAKGDFYFTPQINIRLTIAIDETILLSYYNIHAVTDFEAKEELEIGGEAKGEEKIPFEILGKDFLLPYGFTYYFSPGLKISANGEFAVGATFTQTGRHTMDITYYPLLSLASGIGTMFNSIDQDIKLLSSESDWHYIVGRVTYKGGIFIETGFGFLNHKIIKVGGEFDFGLEFKADFKFDWDMLKSADRNTTLYETIQNSDRVDICPFIGLRGITAIADERIKFSVGKDWDAPWNSFLLKRRILPSFYNVSAQREDLTSASVSSGITNDCLLPMKVGFSVFNSKGEKLWTQYNDQLYSNRLFSFSNFGASFNNLNHLGKYTIYPVISLFGYDMIASPSAEIEIEAKPITLNAVNIEETSAEVFGKIEGYEMIDENVTYGIGYTTEGEGGATLFNAMNYLGGGVFSVKLIALKPNTTYNYYAYLIVDGEMICGGIEQFTTKGNTICPDENHPHMIDLGLPSGTKWACCNIGATKPEDIGSLFAWGETETKDSYSWENYRHWKDTNGDGRVDDNEINIGEDISGTSYDAAKANWGGNWRMPTNADYDELMKNTSIPIYSSEINGRYIIGKNGNKIIMPCNPERYQYWTSVIAKPSSFSPYIGNRNALTFRISYDWTLVGMSPRCDGLYIRPVSK